MKKPKLKKCRWFFLCLVLLITLGLAPSLGSTAHAATLSAILDQAKASYSRGQILYQVISDALSRAQKSGIAPEDIAAPLVQTLMETGLGLGEEPIGLVGSISTYMFQGLSSVVEEKDSLFQAISQAIQGIRAAAANRGLDVNQVRTWIQESLRATAGTDEWRRQLSEIIEDTYKKPHEYTYILTPPPRAVTPPAPPETPAGVSDTYDPTASSS